MHPRTQEVLEYLTTQRAQLWSAVESVPAPLCEHRPADDQWSIVEIVDHLSLVEAQISRLIATRVSEARAAGLGEESETSPVLPTLDAGLLLDRNRKVRAREASRPRGGVSLDLARANLEQVRDTLRATVMEADGLALSQVVAPHPLFGPLNMYQWLIFVGAHEARHTAQIRELAAALVV